jgi:transposase
MAPPPLSPSEPPLQTYRALVLARLHRGEGFSDIARAEGISVTYVARIAKSIGIEPPPRRPTLYDQHAESILTLLAEGRSKVSIAFALDISENAVHSISQRLRDEGRLAPWQPSAANAQRLAKLAARTGSQLWTPEDIRVLKQAAREEWTRAALTERLGRPWAQIDYALRERRLAPLALRIADEPRQAWEYARTHAVRSLPRLAAALGWTLERTAAAYARIPKRSPFRPQEALRVAAKSILARQAAVGAAAEDEPPPGGKLPPAAAHAGTVTQPRPARSKPSPRSRR